MARSPKEILATRTRELRQSHGWTVKELSSRSGLSPRLLALIEAGDANPVLTSLQELADAFHVDVTELLTRAAPQRSVALLGMRGAGKSTVGKKLAEAVGWSFVELDKRIEVESGLSLPALFELHGEPHVRALEARAVRDVVNGDVVVVAVSGGVVTRKETYDLLRGKTRTVWLKATPQEHWDRVRAQGDERPMENRSTARAELDALWAARAPLYEQAQLTIDTSTRSVDETVALIRAQLGL